MRRAFAAFALLVAVPLASAQQGAPDPASALSPIRASMTREDFDQAVSLGEKAIRKEPGSSELWLWLGRAYGRKAQRAPVLSQIGLAKKCKAAFEKAVALDPRNVDARADLTSYYLQAPGLAGGSKAKAREQAAAILELDPVRGHVVLGAVRTSEKDLAGAEAEYRKAIEADPAKLDGPQALASLYVSQKRWADARSLWEERVGTDTGDLYPRYQLARIALFSGTNLEEGVEHLKAYLAVPALPERPTWADAQWRLGLVYEKLGRKDEAKAALQDALTLNPDHPQARKDLERLRGSAGPLA